MGGANGYGTRSRLQVPDAGTISEWQSKMRAAVFNGITQGDIQEIVAGLVAKAKSGDVSACRMVFDYVLGGKEQAEHLAVKKSRPKAVAELNGEPGSTDRIKAMRQRAKNGEEIFDPIEEVEVDLN